MHAARVTKSLQEAQQKAVTYDLYGESSHSISIRI